MTYLLVKWKHKNPDEPIVLYSELDEARMEVRKIDMFADGRWGFADGREEVGGSGLGEAPTPSLEQLNADPVYEAMEDRERRIREVVERSSECTGYDPFSAQPRAR